MNTQGLFYKTDHALVGDVIPYYENGEFHLFYLKNWDDDYRGEGYAPGWHLLKTRDLVHFESETPIGIVGGTGCVIKVDGLYHLYYCIFEQDPQRQYVCHATSPDLENWTRYEDETFGPDERIYLLTDWRDPHVVWNEEEQCWWMVLCAQSQGETRRRGCVGLCKSTDLHHWTCCEPLYAPESSMSAYECPDLFYMNGWWYLVFSQFTDRFRTLYRMSRSIAGPWIRPEVDSFDSRAYYAAKTCSDGEHRYLFGWNPTRTRDLWQCNPRGYLGNDANTWDWGGSLVPHELWQAEDGKLFVKPVKAILDAVEEKRSEFLVSAEEGARKSESRGSEEEKESICPVPLTGDWNIHGNQAEVDTPYGYAALLLGPVAGCDRLSFDVEVKEGTAAFGIAVHVDEEFSDGYYIQVDLWRRRVEFRSPIRMTERGGQMFPYDVELEQPLPSEAYPVQSCHVDVIVSDNILVVYVAGRTALSTRMYDRKGGNFGLFVMDGGAKFLVPQGT